MYMNGVELKSPNIMIVCVKVFNYILAGMFGLETSHQAQIFWPRVISTETPVRRLTLFISYTCLPSGEKWLVNILEPKTQGRIRNAVVTQVGHAALANSNYLVSNKFIKAKFHRE